MLASGVPQDVIGVGQHTVRLRRPSMTQAKCNFLAHGSRSALAALMASDGPYARRQRVASGKGRTAGASSGVLSRKATSTVCGRPLTMFQTRPPQLLSTNRWQSPSRTNETTRVPSTTVSLSSGPPKTQRAAKASSACPSGMPPTVAVRRRRAIAEYQRCYLKMAVS